MIFHSDPTTWLREIFLDTGMSSSLAAFLSTTTLLVIIALCAWISNFIIKTIILQVVTRIVEKSENQWDDVFLEQKVFTRLSHFAPALIIYYLSVWALKPFPWWLALVHNLTYIYMLGIGMIVINSFIESWHQIFMMLPIGKHRSIKGYVQLVKVLVVLVTVLVIVSVVFKKEVSTLIAGLGVMTSVLILVFKDTLVGIVASIQLSSNKMVKVGDWVTIPRREVDGVVSDITLNTVKIQNFDKTIITVPTYALVQDSFQNWSGMEEARARRIKRPLFIDMNSIKFLDTSLRKKLVRIPLLKEYIEESDSEIEGKTNEVESQLLTYNRLTNLGLFRYYAESWLRNHPKAIKDQTLLVRHRTPEGNGLPLEVYLFTDNYQMVGYENFQNEIFEHLFAVLNEFDLKVFQQPTGRDILEITKGK